MEVEAHVVRDGNRGPSETAFERDRASAVASSPTSRADASRRTELSDALVSDILRVVPWSSWTYANVEQNGDVRSTSGSREGALPIADVLDEFRRQRSKSSSGSRIAATMQPLPSRANGITLLFADASTNFGILVLARTEDARAFTSSEIRLLTFALDDASERLSTFRLQPSRPRASATKAIESKVFPDASDSAFYVLDESLRIVMAWSAIEPSASPSGAAAARGSERLPEMLERSVRELVAGWGRDPGGATALRPFDFLVVRAHPILGADGPYVGVRVDRFVPRNSLVAPAERYRISPREVQVLALMLDGERLAQIGTHLHITSSTVQDHIKSMLDKTESRNRSELIARVLGWESNAR